MKDENLSIAPTTSLSFPEAMDCSQLRPDLIPPLPFPRTEEVPLPDIEHVTVEDDPRLWSTRRKTFTLAIVSTAAMIATLGIDIYNPAINDVKADLHATDQQISLSLAVFVLVQGGAPLLWTAISEIRGRKAVYLVSIALNVIGCAVAGAAKSIGVLIAMRVVQAIGGSAVLSIGAATLADIYDPEERGTVVGIFYATLLLGPSTGPLIGGIATQLFSWRATFYLLDIYAGVSMITFIFYKDTFRRERSKSYQSALRATLRDREAKEGRARQVTSRGEKLDGSLDSKAFPEEPRPSFGDVRLSFRDIDPIRPLGSVLKQKNNLTIIFASMLIFGASYCITYTSVLTLAAAPYSYDSLQVGLVLLSGGVGGVLGSILGGRWSDRFLRKRRCAKGGTNCEDRLRSTKPMMLIFAPSLLMYAWMAQEKVHISGICVSLFLVGFSSVWIYSSTLAYIVDANVGRSSTAVATNSLFRGISGFVAAEIAVPLQHGLGDGGLYTLWAGLMVIMSLMILLTIAKGGQWRGKGKRERGVEGIKR